MPDQRRDQHQPTISFPFPAGNGAPSFNTWEAVNSAFWASNKPPNNYRNCRSWNNGEVQFGTGLKVDQDNEPGICSPPLWTTSPPRSPQSRRNYYRSLSPESKTKAVARGQRELMDMVGNMPESTYELSLKDLVEQPRVNVGEEKNNSVGKRNLSQKNGKVGNSRSVDKKGQGKGNGKIDSGGFYLKMVFPNYLVSNKKKKNNNNEANQISKVSPRSSVSEGPAKGADKEWWKKNHSVSGGEGDSGVSSINSGSTRSSGSSSSSSRSNSRHEVSGGSCWSFIRRPVGIFSTNKRCL